MKALKQEDWIQQIESKSLRIKDITELKAGTVLKLLVIDRNALERGVRDNTPNTVYEPEEFFKTSFAMYKHDTDLKGKILFGGDDGKFQDFEFDLYLSEAQCWYPLKNQSIPAKDEQGYFDFNFGKPKYYSEFDKNTEVGWRGPMIMWEELKNMPRVYCSPPASHSVCKPTSFRDA